MSFFDGTATGVIMNRLLQDVQNVDQYVPNSILLLSTKVRAASPPIGVPRRARRVAMPTPAEIAPAEKPRWRVPI